MSISHAHGDCFKMRAVSIAAMFLAQGQALAQAGSQEAPPAPDQTVATDTSGTLEEIIVTAQQRSESLQKAAVPVAVVSGDKLLESGVTGLDSLNKLVPSLQVVASGQGNLIFVRGVGNFSFLSSTDPATAFNYDGVYLGRSSSTVGNFFDLDRIEVLKGPQGTLYGRNATAGAINVLPVQPRFEEWSGYATTSYGNYDALTAEGALNAPLGTEAAVRFSGSYSRHDGYLDDGTSEDESTAFRAQVKAKLAPGFTARLEGNFAHQGGIATGSSYLGRYAFNPVAGQFIVTPSNLASSQGLFTTEAAAFRSTGAAGNLPGRFLDPIARLPYSDNDIYGAHAQFDLETAVGTLTLIPAWAHAVKDNFNVNSGQNVGDRQESDQHSIEARLVSTAHRAIDYIFGLYYFAEDITDDTHNSTGSAANFIKSDYETRSPSVYGRLTLHATDTLRFVGGLRYTEDRKNFSNEVISLGIVCGPGANCASATLLPYTLTLQAQPVLPAAGGPPAMIAPGIAVVRRDALANGDVTTDKITYRGALEFDVAESSMAYASVETGYRTGGFNNDGGTYDPESIRALTIGTKSRFFGDRLQLNSELFYWKYSDQQLSHVDIDSRGTLGVLTRNVGRSTIQGAEIEALAAVTPTTVVSANVQYLKAEYDRFTYLSPVRPLSGCSVTASGGFTVDCSGQPALNSPEWTVNLGLEQVFPTDGLDFVLSANTQYKSGFYTNFDYLEPMYQQGFWRSDVEVAMRSPDGRWTVAGYVRNIEDERSKVFVAGTPGSNLIVSTNTAPRLYGLRLAYRFL